MTRLTCILAAALFASACSSPPSFETDPPENTPESTARVKRRISAFETASSSSAATSVMKIQYQGRPAYLFISPCCDQYNYLYDAEGARLCAPSGGLAGNGDGRCPDALASQIRARPSAGKEVKVSQ